jgi:membrane protein DedA with SNARE-associated domain
MDGLHALLGQLVTLIGSMGYPGIFLLTMMESTFIPLPCELVLIPAGYLSQQGAMNIWVVWLISIFGTLSGSIINYGIAVSLGRKFLLAYGKYMFMPEERFKKVEHFFYEHGSFSTFIGRLVPGVRHFIAFPAGLARIPLSKFCLYTTMGSAIWMGILLGLGYVVGQNKVLIEEYLHIIQAFIGVFVVLLIVSYGLYYSRKKSGHPSQIGNIQPGLEVVQHPKRYRGNQDNHDEVRFDSEISTLEPTPRQLIPQQTAVRPVKKKKPARKKASGAKGGTGKSGGKGTKKASKGRSRGGRR